VAYKANVKYIAMVNVKIIYINRRLFMKMKYLTYMLPACLMVSAASAMKYEFDAAEIPIEKKYSIHITYSEQMGTKQINHRSQPEYKFYEEKVRLQPQATVSGDFFTSDPQKSFDRVQLAIHTADSMLAFTLCTLDVKDGKLKAKIAFNENVPKIEKQ
jgi:hypothetical protein